MSELTVEQFAQVVEGKPLDGSGRAVQTQNGTHTSVIDVSYVSPKSVGELLLRADDGLRRDVIEAFRAAVLEAHEMVHEEAEVCRVSVTRPSVVGKRVCVSGPRKGEVTRTQGSLTRRVPGELLSLSPVVQFSARPTEESDARGAPDPHLHAHVPIFGIAGVADAKAPGGVRYLTPDDSAIKRQAGERGDLVLASFARRLQALGVPVEFHTDRKGRISWEVAHTDPKLRRLLSSNARRADKLRRDHEQLTGQPLGDVELQQRMRVSRKAKTPGSRDFDAAPDWDAWRDIVARAGFELAPYPVLAPIEQAPLAERKATLRARALSPEGLCRDDATFARADIRKTLARCGMDLGFTRQQLTQISAELEQDLVVVRQASDPRHEYLTTLGLLNRERYIASTADAKATATVPAPDPTVVDAALRASAMPLDAEQRAAVRAACAPNAWAKIEGLAGTGKTTALSAAVAAYRAAGADGTPTADQVIVVCVAAATAERTGRKLGADRWYSVEGFRQAVAKGALSPTERSLVLVDEACMVNTFQEADLLRAAGQAQMVNIGDPGQLTPIGAGGWYGPQAERHHPVRLRTVHRHKDPDDTADYTRLHDGQAYAAVQGLSRRGRVQIRDNPEDRIGTAVGDYARWRNQGRTATDVLTVIDGANRQVDTVNRLIQQDRLRRGELGAEWLAVTATDEGRSWRFHVGDHVIFLDPYRRPRLSVRNGSAGEVTGLDVERRHVRIRLTDQDREITVRLAEPDHRQPVGLAYAMHAAKFQGGEIDVVQALPGSARVTNANAGYSQLTRAKEAAHVYLDRRTHGKDPLDGIAQAWSRPAPTLSVLQRLHADRQRLATTTAGAKAKQAPATPTQRARRLRAQAPPTPRLGSRPRAGATPPASPSGSRHDRTRSRLAVLR